ncbi:MAG TPA: hypothetical protein VN030_04520 [Cellvibrio sp.]|nr:hypothetical protein [Cellvibrio sp.]
MFNWRYRFKDQTEFLSPEGPGFAWAPWKTFELSGTQIKIKVPRHRTTHANKSVNPSRAYRLDQLQNEYYQRNGIRSCGCLIMSRSWQFYGPWFTGKKGTIRMAVTIVSPTDIPKGLNYFHPRAFEGGVSDFLTTEYGGQFSVTKGTQMWIAPVNWAPRTDFPCIAARFDASNTVVEHEGPDCYLFIPLSKHQLLRVSCQISRNVILSDRVPEPTVDEWIDLAPFLQLANQVLDSVQVTLSPQAQDDQAEALAGLEDKSLVKDFPPIQWLKK